MKMRRFAVSYLTVSVIIILLANLALVVLYARQFGLNAQALVECFSSPCQTNNGSMMDFVVVNSILVGLLLVIWFVVTKFRFFHQPNN